MIVSSLKYSGRIESLHPRFGELFRYVKERFAPGQELGRIELDAERLFVNYVLLDGVGKERQPLEMHRRYIDVHILLEGCETVGWKNTDDLKTITQPYDTQSDCALSADKPASYTTLAPGDFMIVWPEDAHAPAIGEGKIRKLIAKVLIEDESVGK